jgi:hypothetical protein
MQPCLRIYFCFSPLLVCDALLNMEICDKFDLGLFWLKQQKLLLAINQMKLKAVIFLTWSASLRWKRETYKQCSLAFFSALSKFQVCWAKLEHCENSVQLPAYVYCKHWGCTRFKLQVNSVQVGYYFIIM